MLGVMTTSAVILALLSLAAAAVALGWLSKVSKHLVELGGRILESEEIEKIIKASDKTISFESRMTGCEEKADGSQKQLAEHEAKLSELAAKAGTTEQVVDRHTTDLATASEKTASLELRFDGFENNVNDKLNQLPEHETKINELGAKLASVEETVNKNGADLAEDNRNVKTLTDEIQSLKKFETATEKTRSLILAAFTDMGAVTPPEDGLGIMPETATDETSQGPEDGQEEAKDQQMSEIYE